MSILDSLKSGKQKAQFEADRFLRINRAQREVTALKRQVQQTKLKLGSAAYSAYQKEELSGDPLLAFCVDIDALEADILAKEQEIEEIKKEIPAELLEAGLKSSSSYASGAGEIPTGYKISGPAAVLALLLFFMPWVFVSCGGQGIGSFSGFQIAVGPSVQTGFGVERMDGAPLVFLVLLSALAVLGITYRWWNNKVLTKVDSIGHIILGIVPLLVVAYYFINTRADAAEQGILIESMYGLWGVILANIAVIVGGVMNGRASPGAPGEIGLVDDLEIV